MSKYIKLLILVVIVICTIYFLKGTTYFQSLFLKRSDATNGDHNTSASVYKLYGYEDTNYFGGDVRKAHLEFLPEFKNPCWVERYTGDNVYERNIFVRNPGVANKWRFRQHLGHLDPGGVTVQLDNGECTAVRSCRLRCLPYFMLIGVAKSGTSDINSRILHHPEIFQACRKELYWWNQYRYILNVTLGSYSDLFDNSLGQLLHDEDSLDSSDIRQYKYTNILGEFTSMTFFDFAHWREDMANKNLLEPQMTSPNDIKAILPNVKLIVILRNPTYRLYSSYNMFRRSGTPEKFHECVLGSIWWWETCVRQLPERNCAYGSPPGILPVYDKIGSRTEWWKSSRNYTGEIRHGMYGLIIKDWLSVFPRENILFLRLEDYSSNLSQVYNEEIFPFLGVSKLNNSPIFDKTKFKPSFKKTYKPMLEKTKAILDDFYSAFNKDLANALQDDKWLWK